MIKAYNIIWDTDGDDIDLPNEIEIPDDIADDEDEISDYISNVTGFCHFGYMLERDGDENDGSYTAIAYEDDCLCIAAQDTYDDKDEAIRFAKAHNWDEVRDDKTGKIVWRR